MVGWHRSSDTQPYSQIFLAEIFYIPIKRASDNARLLWGCYRLIGSEK